MMRRRSIGKPALLAGCALGAWLAIAPSAATAQAFQGNGTVVTGDASITTGAGSTSVLLGTSETVINWTPFDTTGTGTIDFLPADNTALFSSGFSNFTVLNRILPQDANGAPTARAVSLNGNVGSFISDPVTFNRGNVWFYSPTGIIVGPTAFFSVGSLVLTTNDIGFTENCGPCETYGSIYGPGGLVQFRGPENALTTVDIREGARIGALGPNGYVAIVAPRIVQAGTVVADGSIAYLAAEQADVTINAGLFNFTLLVGTTDPNGIVHSGTSTGTASTGYFTDPKAITVAAVSKNDALTMLLSGSLGYLPASNVFDDGSSVFLTAGNSASPADNISIGDTSFGNRLDAYAAGDITVAPTAGSAATGDPGGETAFASYANLFANRSLTLRAVHGSSITALNSLNVGAYDALGNGGTLTIEALSASGLSAPGAIAITGGLFATASGFGVSPPEAQFGGDGVGGSIALKASGGTIAADFLALEANGNGGFAELLGGDGTGGTILISAGYGGSITSPSTSIYARGNGGGVYGFDGFGGVGNGGAIELTDSGTDLGADAVGGQLALGSLTLNASADGGYSGDFGSGHGGDAFGGTVDVAVSLQDQSFDSFYATVNAHDGDTAIDPLAGTIDMVIGGGVIVDVANDLLLTANSLSGVNGGPAATGTGGTVNLTIQPDSTLNVAGAFYGQARADVAEPFGNIVVDSTPTLTGGTVNVTADGGAFNVGSLLIDVTATNLGAASFAGPATGGTATVSALSGGSITVDNGFGTALLTISADGYGAPGPSPAHAAGGTARLIAEDGSVNVLGDAKVSASGLTREFFEPPPDGPGHNATGGTATVELRPGSLGTASLAADDLTINAIGDGRLSIVPIQGDGGDGTGGMAGLTVAGGTLALDRVTLDSSGIGASSAASGNATALRSGDGFGGTARFSASGGTSSIGSLQILAPGTGGGGAPDAVSGQLAARGGGATGGTAELLVSDGLLDVLDITIDASALGADGMGHLAAGAGADGGFAIGGSALFTMPGGSTGTFTTTALIELDAAGFGGAGGGSFSGVGGNGGDATGGSAIASLSDGAFALGEYRALADGYGGFGFDGGLGAEGRGGFAEFSVIDMIGASGGRSVGDISLLASGAGGFGAGGFAGSDAGNTTLSAQVADAASALSVNGGLLANSRGTNIPLAGAGFSLNVSGAPLVIAGNALIDSARDAVIAAADPFNVNGNVSLNARSLTETGQISATGAVAITTTDFLSAERIRSGANTSLSAANGPLRVSIDLDSFGNVSAQAQSVDIHSLGALTFALARATGGDLYIGTVGNLEVASLSAAGSATLETSAGNITTGDFNAGTFIYVDAFGSANLGNIVAGTDAAVTTRGGALTVGNVTAGDDIWLSIFGTDNTRVLMAGNLLTTGLGADDAAGPPELFGGPGPTGNVARLRSSGSLVVGDMQSPGRAILVADAGTTTAGELSADGALIVLGRGNIALDAIATEGRFYVADSAMFLPNLPDAYEPASLDGLTPVRTSGGLTIGSAVEAGDITVAIAGTATAPSWTSAGGLFIDSGGLFTSGVTVSAGGNASITADSGIDLTVLTVGGTTLLRSPLGSVEVGNLLSTGAVTARGRSVDIASGGALTFADIEATAGNLVVATGGNLALATADATGTATLTSATGGIAATGAVSSGGAFSATAPAGLTFASLTSGSTTQLTSPDGAIDVDSLVSPGLVSVSGRGVFLDGSGPLSFATAVSTGEMAITASGSLAFAAVQSDLELTLTSTTGSITTTGDVRGGFPNLTAAGNILIAGNLASLGTLVVNAGGSFTVEGDTGADDAQITADQGIAMASLRSGEITRLDSPNGNIVIPELLTGGRVTARGLDVEIDSSGSLLFDEARASREDVRITVADNLTIGEAFASNEIVLDAGGTFSLSGTANGFTIDVTAADIVLGDESRLGLQDATRDLTLRNGDSESETFIGGSGGPSETWSLDRNEAARMFVDETITILADGDITIDDLAMSFGAGGTNIGAGGLLEISTPGEVNIIGDVALTTSGPDDTFRIDPRLIALNTDTGSIAMTLFAGEGGGGGTPQGRLELIGDRIVAATGANITQLETLTDLDAIAALFGQPGGTGEPLSAGTIHLDVIESLYIQNSGASEAFADRRGFAASGLEIATESNATQIAINGRILIPSGAATGLETAPLVSINGAAAAAGGRFDPRSTINGCVIGADCNPPPEPELPHLDLPTSEDVESPVPSQSERSLFVAQLIELAGTEPLITPPLVDEPITGVGNDDLWEPRCEPGEEGSPCPEDDGRP